METSAPKRRKTSPLTSVPVESTATTTTPQDPPPAKTLLENIDENTHPRIPRTSSYASPTKASLAKHHPDILRRRPSSPRKQQNVGADDASSRKQAEAPSPEPDDQLRAEQERASQLYQRSEGSPSRSPIRHFRGSLAARPRRSPVKPNPRPLPPPAPTDDFQGITDPFARRGLRRSPLAGMRAPEPEPDLPPTPVGVDHAASTPPAGIHSTPTRRPRRSRALAEKIRSSPSKQPPTKQHVPSSQHTQEQILPTVETESRRPPSGPKSIEAVGRITTKPKSRPRPSDVRGVEPEDANSEKKRERRALEAEVAELERDLRIAAGENGRIQLSRIARQEIALPSDPSDLFGVIERHLIPPKKDIATDQSPSWLQRALDCIGFLPFGKPSSSLPTLFPEDASPDENEKEPTSHHPVPMTAQETLPFLQTFTPLTFTSRITMLDRPTKQDPADTIPPLLQEHIITAISAATPGLFSARIKMTVDTATHTITSLTLPAIDPPLAAAELASLTSQILTPELEAEQSATSSPPAPAPLLSRNISVLTWSMGSWLRIAVRRAKAWRTLDRSLGTADDLARTVARVRSSKSHSRLKRKIAGSSDAAENNSARAEGRSDVASVASSDEGWTDILVDTDELLPYMGRSWMEFRIPSPDGSDRSDVVLRVRWRVEFDWTGEGRSRVEVVARVPGKWHRADDRATLAKVSGLFDELLQRGSGVVHAVETIVTLLAGEQR